MKSILAKATLTLALTASLIPFTTGIAEVKIGEKSNIQSADANDWKKWGARHEHPFWYLGRYRFSQHEGNMECHNAWNQLGATREWSVGANTQHGGYSSTQLRKEGWDGKNISRPWHIWYHRRDGLCVANQ